MSTIALAPSSGRRVRRSWLAVPLAIAVAAAASIAAAYFIERETVPNNRAVSADLAPLSDQFLPLDFGNDTLYPTDADEPDTVVSDQFTVMNTNDVPVQLILSAACSNCSPGSDAQAQYDNLYVDLTAALVTPDGSSSAPTEDEPRYRGRLADLTEEMVAIVDSGARQGFQVQLWLADDGTEQPQATTTTWDLVLTTQTVPPTPTPTTTEA